MEDTVKIVKIGSYWYEPDDVGVEYQTDLCEVELTCGDVAYVYELDELKFCPCCGQPVKQLRYR